MWVMGHLKDDLGIKHRKASKNRPEVNDVTSRELEAAPIFAQSHLRSNSEVSLTASPHPAERGFTSSASPQADMPAIREYPYDENHYGDGRDQHYQQPRPQHAGLSPGYALTPPPVSGSPDFGRSSYYSVSDLPSPSPQPSPLYKYPDGQVTATPPRSRGSTLRSPPQSPPISPFSHTSPQRARIPAEASGYEMRIRSPPRQQPHLGTPQSKHEQDASDASFFSAHEDIAGSQDETPASRPYGASGVPPSSHLQPQTDDPYGGLEPRHDDRRASQVSWTGGRAL